MFSKTFVFAAGLSVASLALACSPKAEITASARCSPRSNADGLAPTGSAVVTVTSSVDLAGAGVRVDMLDASGKFLDHFDAHVNGPITADQPMTERYRVGAPTGTDPQDGWESVASCTATVTSNQLPG
jgi:hypothetical protein